MVGANLEAPEQPGALERPHPREPRGRQDIARRAVFAVAQAVVVELEVPPPLQAEAQAQVAAQLQAQLTEAPAHAVAVRQAPLHHGPLGALQQQGRGVGAEIEAAQRPRDGDAGRVEHHRRERVQLDALAKGIVVEVEEAAQGHHGRSQARVHQHHARQGPAAAAGLVLHLAGAVLLAREVARPLGRHLEHGGRRGPGRPPLGREALAVDLEVAIGEAALDLDHAPGAHPALEGLHRDGPPHPGSHLAVGEKLALTLDGARHVRALPALEQELARGLLHLQLAGVGQRIGAHRLEAQKPPAGPCGAPVAVAVALGQGQRHGQGHGPAALDEGQLHLALELGPHTVQADLLLQQLGPLPGLLEVAEAEAEIPAAPALALDVQVQIRPGLQRAHPGPAPELGRPDPGQQGAHIVGLGASHGHFRARSRQGCDRPDAPGVGPAVGLAPPVPHGQVAQAPLHLREARGDLPGQLSGRSTRRHDQPSSIAQQRRGQGTGVLGQPQGPGAPGEGALGLGQLGPPGAGILAQVHGQQGPAIQGPPGGLLQEGGRARVVGQVEALAWGLGLQGLGGRQQQRQAGPAEGQPQAHRRGLLQARDQGAPALAGGLDLGRVPVVARQQGRRISAGQVQVHGQGGAHAEQRSRGFLARQGQAEGRDQDQGTPQGTSELPRA